VHAERIRIVPSAVDPSRVQAAPGCARSDGVAWGVSPGESWCWCWERSSVARGTTCSWPRSSSSANGSSAPSGLLWRRRRAGRAGGRAEASAGACCCPVLRTTCRPCSPRPTSSRCRRHEGLGVAALEAMAAGKVVVASRVGGLADLVVDGERTARPAGRSGGAGGGAIAGRWGAAHAPGRGRPDARHPRGTASRRWRKARSRTAGAAMTRSHRGACGRWSGDFVASGSWCWAI
jgi:hypothetical protein